MSSRWGVHCVTQWKSDRIGHNFGKKSRNSFTQLLAMAVDSLLRSWRLAAFQCFDSLWIWDRSRSWLVRILSWCTMYFSNCGWNSPLSCLICLQHLASWFQSPKSSLSLFVSFAMILSAYRSRLRCAELCCQHAVAGVAFMRWVSAEDGEAGIRRCMRNSYVLPGPISLFQAWWERPSWLEGILAITGWWSIPEDPLKVVQLRSMILIFAAKPGQKQRALQYCALVVWNQAASSQHARLPSVHSHN